MFICIKLAIYIHLLIIRYGIDNSKWILKFAPEENSINYQIYHSLFHNNILIRERFRLLRCLIWDNNIIRVEFKRGTGNWVKSQNQNYEYREYVYRNVTKAPNT